jgi:hypothetical protein
VFANCCISVVFTCFVCIINTLLLSLSSLPMKITPYRWNKPYSIINESWIKVVKKFWNNGSSSELYPEFLSKLYQISLPKENVMKALTKTDHAGTKLVVAVMGNKWCFYWRISLTLLGAKKTKVYASWECSSSNCLTNLDSSISSFIYTSVFFVPSRLILNFWMENNHAFKITPWC